MLLQQLFRSSLHFATSSTIVPSHIQDLRAAVVHRKQQRVINAAFAQLVSISTITDTLEPQLALVRRVLQVGLGLHSLVHLLAKWDDEISLIKHW